MSLSVDWYQFLGRAERRPLGTAMRLGGLKTPTTLRFSADSLPRCHNFVAHLRASFRLLRPALSTAEIWTNTSLPPLSG
jgi:hypothetical protein